MKVNLLTLVYKLYFLTDHVGGVIPCQIKIYPQETVLSYMFAYIYIYIWICMYLCMLNDIHMHVCSIIEHYIHGSQCISGIPLCLQFCYLWNSEISNSLNSVFWIWIFWIKNIRIIYILTCMYACM